MSAAALPTPVETESLRVPGDDRVGLDQDEGLAPLGPEAMKGNPQEPIRCPEPDPSSLGPLQNSQLVAEGEDLELQRGLSPQGGG